MMPPSLDTPASHRGKLQVTATDIGLLILRAGAGMLLLGGHGWPKLLRFGELAVKFPDPLGVGTLLSLILAVAIEAGCSALVVLGVATRWFAAPVAVLLLVAAFIVHADDPFSKKEFALLFAIPFVALVFTGGGRLSLDRLLEPRYHSWRRGKMRLP